MNFQHYNNLRTDRYMNIETLAKPVHCCNVKFQQKFFVIFSKILFQVLKNETIIFFIFKFSLFNFQHCNKLRTDIRITIFIRLDQTRLHCCNVNFQQNPLLLSLKFSFKFEFFKTINFHFQIFPF